MERFPCLICALSITHPNSNCATPTWNWRRVTTDPGLLQKKPPRASRSMGVLKTHRVCGAFSTNVKSPLESSRYEHCSCPSRCSPGVRIHRGRSPLSLHCGHAFRLLCGAPIPRLHHRPLGLQNQHLLEQTSHQKTRPDGMLSKERNGLSLVLAPALPPDRPREHPQSPATRNRIHPAPPWNPRFCAFQPTVSVFGNRAGKGQFFLRSAENPASLSTLQALSRPANLAAYASLFRRQFSDVSPW